MSEKKDWSLVCNAVVKTPFNGLLSVRVHEVNSARVTVYHKRTGITYKFKPDGTPIEHTDKGYSLHLPDSFEPSELEKFF